MLNCFMEIMVLQRRAGIFLQLSCKTYLKAFSIQHLDNFCLNMSGEILLDKSQWKFLTEENPSISQKQN